MKLYQFGIVFALLINLSCGSSNTNTKVFELVLQPNQKSYQKNDQLKVKINNPEEHSIEAIRFELNNSPIEFNNDSITLNTEQLGTLKLSYDIDYEGKTYKDSKTIQVFNDKAPKIYTYELVATYPHDQTAYTQGLEFYKGVLYESTGLRGASSLRKVDYTTGKVLKKIDLDPTVFGEGITIINDTIYMLTWQSKIGYLFDLDFNKIGEFTYGQSKEGWGLTHDTSNQIYKSDGTQNIWKLNSNSLIEEDKIQTVTNKSFFNKTNELEYVDGKIYANVYLKESMMIIDANSGAIEGVINFGGLKEKVSQHPALDVLNGVAYHPDRKTFFVTGKKWDQLFEVKIVEKK